MKVYKISDVVIGIFNSSCKDCRGMYSLGSLRVDGASGPNTCLLNS